MNNTTETNKELIKDSMYDLLVNKLEVVANQAGIDPSKFEVRKPRLNNNNEVRG